MNLFLSKCSTNMVSVKIEYALNAKLRIVPVILSGGITLFVTFMATYWAQFSILPRIHIHSRFIISIL